MKTILRWIAVLPVAVIGAFLFYAFFRMILWLSRAYVGDVFFVNKILLECIAEAVTGVGFVMAGTKIAPFHKRKVATILCVVFCLIGICLIVYFSFNIHYLENPVWTYVATIASMIGAVIMAYNIQKELPKEKT